MSVLSVAARGRGTGAETMPTDSLPALNAWMTREMKSAYAASPYLRFSRDYFTRFTRDPDAKPAADEVAIDGTWTIVLPEGANPVARRMADDLAEFFERSMGTKLGRTTTENPHSITLIESGGGDPAVAESYTLDVRPGAVIVQGRDVGGLRAGIVTLVDLVGARQAPFMHVGKTVYRPRLPVRLGPVPYLGSYRELAFMGYNAAHVGGPSLFEVSTSNAIPELAARRKPETIRALAESAKSAKAYGLRTYAGLYTTRKFPKDDPVFLAHPELRGALTWKADGEYVLCTEHPLVQRWLEESVANLFRDVPDLDGVYVLVGGEGFYHCFMRAYGVGNGHTTCPRCEPLGPDVVVSNLVNRLATAARSVRPDAEVVAWLYSAEHVWSSDRAQSGFIARLKPGAGVFTEMEKDEVVYTPSGLRKSMWDYSLHMTGAGERAKQQIEACRKVGVPIYLKSEPDCTFEAPRLANLPAMDRWAARAEAIADGGASGAWVFSGFHVQFGLWPCELQHYFWREPHDSPDAVLDAFAARLAGRAAGPHLRAAWRAVSESIEYSPEIPQYYTGPYYLGPAHPMCADPSATLPPAFFGRYLFFAEMTDEEGLRLRPTFFTGPTADADKKEASYRAMEAKLKRAADEVEVARPQVPARCRDLFDGEATQILWLYHTERTQANFLESCRLRDRLGRLWKTPKPADREEAQRLYDRWRAVLADELENANAAIPLMNADVRLDFRFFGDHTFDSGATMLRAKVALVERELSDYLPSRWKQYEQTLQSR